MKKKSYLMIPKKIVLGLLLAGAFFAGYRIACEKERNTNVIDREQVGLPVLFLCELSVYKMDEQYLVTIYKEGAERKACIFTIERDCSENYGISLIKNVSIEQFIGVNSSTVQLLLGEPHANIGSMSYTPAYITEDAYLIYFHFEGDKVFEVYKKDLLTGTLIDSLSLP